jgi:hypothetical protein
LHITKLFLPADIVSPLLPQGRFLISVGQSMAQYVRVLCVLLCALLSVAMVVDSRPSPLFTITDSEAAQNEQAVNTGRKLFKLVSNTLVLPYHHGPLLAGSGSEPLNV